MFTITNGFTYIAFLMFLAGGLLALEKYAKWKVFNVVPPLVWIYVLNWPSAPWACMLRTPVRSLLRFEEQPAVRHDLRHAAAV